MLFEFIFNLSFDIDIDIDIDDFYATCYFILKIYVYTL